MTAQQTQQPREPYLLGTVLHQVACMLLAECGGVTGICVYCACFDALVPQVHWSLSRAAEHGALHEAHTLDA